MHMSALGLPGYHLHAAYAGDWQLSPTEVRTPHARVISLKAQPGPGPRGGGNVCVMGKSVQGACFSVFPLKGREWGKVAREEVYLCGSTRGRWVLLKKS